MARLKVLKLPPQEQVAEKLSKLNVRTFWEWFEKDPETYIAVLRQSSSIQRNYMFTCGLVTSDRSDLYGFSGYSKDWTAEQWIKFISFWPKFSLFQNTAPRVCVQALGHIPPDVRSVVKRHFGRPTPTVNEIEGMSDENAFNYLVSKGFKCIEDIVAHSFATGEDVKSYKRTNLTIRLLRHFLDLQKADSHLKNKTAVITKSNKKIAELEARSESIEREGFRLPEWAKNELIDTPRKSVKHAKGSSAARKELSRLGRPKEQEMFILSQNKKFTALWHESNDAFKSMIDVIGLTQADLKKLPDLFYLLKMKFLDDYAPGTEEEHALNLKLLMARQHGGGFQPRAIEDENEED